MEHDISYWKSICPFELSENDIKSLMTKTDAEWSPHTWAELKEALLNKNHAIITRYPTSMRRYILWRKELSTEFDNVTSYVMQHRLGWPLPTGPSYEPKNPTPFADASDYCFRRNDWPYAAEDGVTHVIVWMKTPITMNEHGDPTEEMEELIEDFVERTFRNVLHYMNSRPNAEVIWFRNRPKWMSVGGLEHIHVLMYGVSDRLVEHWTGQSEGDIVQHQWVPTDEPK